jgi:hypothetical protein
MREYKATTRVGERGREEEEGKKETGKEGERGRRRERVGKSIYKS